MQTCLLFSLLLNIFLPSFPLPASAYCRGFFTHTSPPIRAELLKSVLIPRMIWNLELQLSAVAQSHWLVFFFSLSSSLHQKVFCLSLTPVAFLLLSGHDSALFTPKCFTLLFAQEEVFFLDTASPLPVHLPPLAGCRRVLFLTICIQVSVLEKKKKLSGKTSLPMMHW